MRCKQQSYDDTFPFVGTVTERLVTARAATLEYTAVLNIAIDKH